MRKIESYEIHPVVETPLGYRATRYADEASFWTLYGVLSTGELVAVGDFNSQEEALTAQQLIEQS
jgi:hypothetical protein